MPKNMTVREYYASIQALAADATPSATAIADMRSRGITASDEEIHAAFRQFVSQVKAQSLTDFDKAMTAASKPRRQRLAVDSGNELRAGWPSGGCWGGPGNVGIGDAIWGSIGYLF